jgi:hypothetical protein
MKFGGKVFAWYMGGPGFHSPALKKIKRFMMVNFIVCVFYHNLK